MHKEETWEFIDTKAQEVDIRYSIMHKERNIREETWEVIDTEAREVDIMIFAMQYANCLTSKFVFLMHVLRSR